MQFTVTYYRNTNQNEFSLSSCNIRHYTTTLHYTELEEGRNVRTYRLRRVWFGFLDRQQGHLGEGDRGEVGGERLELNKVKGKR
jgi:hypothetical protein